MWAASPSSLSKAEGGCGGVGIWYKRRRSLPGTGPLGRGGRPEDGVNVSSLEVRLFQVLTSSLSALPWGPSSLGHQGAPRGAEPFWVPQLATRDCCAGPHVHGLHPRPAPTCRLQKACRLTLLLTCCSPAVLWPLSRGVALVAQPVGSCTAAGGGRMDLGCPRCLWRRRPSPGAACARASLPSEGTEHWVLTVR